MPQSWAELTFTQQLLIERDDPEAAAVFKGVMAPELEATVLAGQWSSDAPEPRDLAAEREQAIQQAMAGLAEQSQAMREANERRNAAGEANRRASIDLVNAQLKAQAGGYR